MVPGAATVGSVAPASDRKPSMTRWPSATTASDRAGAHELDERARRTACPRARRSARRAAPSSAVAQLDGDERVALGLDAAQRPRPTRPRRTPSGLTRTRVRCGGGCVSHGRHPSGRGRRPVTARPRRGARRRTRPARGRSGRRAAARRPTGRRRSPPTTNIIGDRRARRARTEHLERPSRRRTRRARRQHAATSTISTTDERRRRPHQTATGGGEPQAVRDERREEHQERLEDEDRLGELGLRGALAAHGLAVVRDGGAHRRQATGGRRRRRRRPTARRRRRRALVVRGRPRARRRRRGATADGPRRRPRAASPRATMPATSDSLTSRRKSARTKPTRDERARGTRTTGRARR